MRICFLSLEDIIVPPGGIATYLQNICGYLADKGHDVHVISRKFKDTPFYENYNGIHIHRVNAPGPTVLYAPFFFIASRKKLLQLSRKHPFDLIHGDMPLMESLALLLLDHPPLIQTLHTTVSGLLTVLSRADILRGNVNELLTRLLSPALFYFERICFLQANKIIAVSDGLRKMAIGKYKGISSKIVVIPNGIQYEKFSNKESKIRDAVRNQLGIDKTDYVVLYLGRLMEQKRVIDLVQAVPKLLRKITNVKLVIVGRRTKNSQHLEDMIFKLGLKQNVIMVDHISYIDVQNYYWMADVYALPSSSEGFPFTVLEAMASGIPVVASNIPGITEQISDKETGLLHPVGDIDTIASRIILLNQNGELVKKITTNAQAMVKHKYTWEVIGQQTELLFKQVIENEIEP